MILRDMTDSPDQADEAPGRDSTPSAPPIDAEAKDSADERWRTLRTATQSYGRIEEIGSWICATQGTCPPRRVSHPVLIRVTSDHGLSDTIEPERSRLLRDQTLEAVRAMADDLGVAVRTVDTGSIDGLPRRTGSVDTVDASTVDQVIAAMETGRRLVDSEVDSGTDLMAVTGGGPGSQTVAAAIIGLFTSSNPVAVSGQGPGIDDTTWMQRTTSIRDAMHRGTHVKGDPAVFLATVGGLDVAVITGILLQAAARRTPVILDGSVAAAAALIAQRKDFRSRQWWMAASRSTDPALDIALDRLDLDPLLDLKINAVDGTAALAALPLIRTAITYLQQEIPGPDGSRYGPGMKESGMKESVQRHTPLHTRHVEAGATMADFGGWDMPIEYTGTVGEHTSVREDVGVFDVSHMGYAEITGTGAVSWLNSILANDLNRIDDGQAQYTLLCDDAGGVIDDLIVYRIHDDAAFIIPNAANSDAVVEALTLAANGTDISVGDRRAEFGILAVQGPRSSAVIESLGLPTGHDYMSFERTMWNDHPIVVARTGYTGERGFELLVSSAGLPELWDALIDAGAMPCGLGARDTLRTEMGYPLHGHELSLDITPVQARLSWAVGWDKPTFSGADALRAERERGATRVLRGLLATGRGVPRAGMAITDGQGEVVGITTSGTYSPTLKQGIALGLLDPAIADGAEVSIDVRGRALPCVVAKPPFVESHVR